MDTISNLYYGKKQVFEPHELTKLHFIAAQPRLMRIEWLAHKILGTGYTLSSEGVGYLPEEVSGNEDATFAAQSEFLEPMREGDDAWLDGRFYNGPFYDAVQARVLEAAATEPFIGVAVPAGGSNDKEQV
jgi:hypothetical protein